MITKTNDIIKIPILLSTDKRKTKSSMPKLPLIDNFKTHCFTYIPCTDSHITDYLLQSIFIVIIHLIFTHYSQGPDTICHSKPK